MLSTSISIIYTTITNIESLLVNCGCNYNSTTLPSSPCNYHFLYHICSWYLIYCDDFFLVQPTSKTVTQLFKKRLPHWGICSAIVLTCMFWLGLQFFHVFHSYKIHTHINILAYKVFAHSKKKKLHSLPWVSSHIYMLNLDVHLLEWPVYWTVLPLYLLKRKKTVENNLAKNVNLSVRKTNRVKKHYWHSLGKHTHKY